MRLLYICAFGESETTEYLDHGDMTAQLFSSFITVFSSCAQAIIMGLLPVYTHSGDMWIFIVSIWVWLLAHASPRLLSGEVARCIAITSWQESQRVQMFAYARMSASLAAPYCSQELSWLAMYIPFERRYILHMPLPRRLLCFQVPS